MINLVFRNKEYETFAYISYYCHEFLEKSIHFNKIKTDDKNQLIDILAGPNLSWSTLAQLRRPRVSKSPAIYKRVLRLFHARHAAETPNGIACREL